MSLLPRANHGVSGRNHWILRLATESDSNMIPMKKNVTSVLILASLSRCVTSHRHQELTCYEFLNGSVIRSDVKIWRGRSTTRSTKHGSAMLRLMR